MVDNSSVNSGASDKGDKTKEKDFHPPPFQKVFSCAELEAKTLRESHSKSK